MICALSLTSVLHKKLRAHLFPGDGLESAAILLCHLGTGKLGFRLMVKEFIPIHSEDCPVRSSVELSWPFADNLPPDKVTEIEQRCLSIFTIHSHPSGHDQFSSIDNQNDKILFKSVCNWFDDGRPNGSAIMTPNGRITSRMVDAKGKFTLFETNSVVGEDIRIWKEKKAIKSTENQGMRILQTFGKGTYELLRKMRVGVVGCSGTGSIVTELLARNCIGNLVIVDPDCIEEKNLNRIINSTQVDARKSIPKVETAKKSISKMGTKVCVETYQSDTTKKEVIEALVDCDVIFGCVDSAEGRYHLECIAAAYFIPYFDAGVNLEVDEKTNNITQADAVAHYMHPGNSSLMSRGGYTSAQVTAEGWYRTNREYYEKQRVAGYLAEVGEDQPAVMSINMQAACMAFNDFLARLHVFRLDNNDSFSSQRFRLVHGDYAYNDEKVDSDSIFKKYSGMGDESFLIKRLKN